MPRLTTRDSQRCWDIPGLKCKLCSYSTHRTRSKILKIKLRNISLYTDLQDFTTSAMCRVRVQPLSQICEPNIKLKGAECCWYSSIWKK